MWCLPPLLSDLLLWEPSSLRSGCGGGVCRLFAPRFLISTHAASQMGLLKICFAAVIPALNFPDVRGGSSTLSVILLISHFHISDILIVSMTILGKVRGDETSGLILLSYSDLSRFVHPLIHLVNCHRAKSAINLDRVSSSCYFLLIQLARAHPPFPTLGNYPHSSRHVFMFLKIIRCSSLRSLT